MREKARNVKITSWDEMTENEKTERKDKAKKVKEKVRKVKITPWDEMIENEKKENLLRLLFPLLLLLLRHLVPRRNLFWHSDGNPI